MTQETNAPLHDRPIKLADFDKLIALHEKRAERNFDTEDLIPKRLDFAPGRDGKRPTVLVSNGDFKNLPLSLLSLHQTYALLDIPGGYADRLLKHDPDFLCENMRRAAKETPDSWLVRFREPENGGDPYVRAVLKNNFACVDNVDVLKTLAEVKDAAAQVKLVEPTLRGQVLGDTINIQTISSDLKIKRGDDWYHPGLHVINSETGESRTQIDAALYRTLCTNSLVSGSDSGIRFSQYHVGRRLDTLHEDILNVVRNLKDIMAPTMTMLKRSQEYTIRGLDAPDSDVPDRLRSAINTSSKTKCGGEVVDLFLARRDYTVYGLIQAISRIANEQVPTIATRLRGLAGNPNRSALRAVLTQTCSKAA